MAQYEEPYESPIEQRFAWDAWKRLRPEVALEKQVWVQTHCGNFRLDFVARTPGNRRVGIECDGKNFHDRRRDEWRDALVLSTGACDVIYRLRGKDIWARPSDVLYVLTQLERELFSDSGLTTAATLAARSVKEADLDPDADSFWIEYSEDEADPEVDDPMDDPEDDPETGPPYLYLQRRRLDAGGSTHGLIEKIDFSIEHAGHSLEQLLVAWDRRQP